MSKLKTTTTYLDVTYISPTTHFSLSNPERSFKTMDDIMSLININYGGHWYFCCKQHQIDDIQAILEKEGLLYNREPISGELIIAQTRDDMLRVLTFVDPEVFNSKPFKYKFENADIV